jgi:hypothetical protein
VRLGSFSADNKSQKEKDDRYANTCYPQKKGAMDFNPVPRARGGRRILIGTLTDIFCLADNLWGKEAQHGTAS